MFNHGEIKKLTNKYNFSVKDMGNGLVYITSKYDEWYASLENRFIKLYHRNTRISRDKYHLHRKINTIENVFETIYNHDKWVSENRYRYSKSTERLRYLFEIINSNKKNSLEFS